MKEGMRLTPRKSASRKFTDIILSSASKWANWDPALRIEAGDYGSVDRKTGQFERAGNIYSDPDVAHIAERFPRTTGPCIDTYKVHTMDARTIHVGPEVHANIFGMAQPTVAGQFQFSRSRGALLILYKSYITSVPNELLDQLKKMRWVRGKCIVTHSQACCGYFLYLSDKSGEELSVALHADAPLPMAPGIAPGAGINLTWRYSGASGVLQHALNDEPVFYPLYQLKETTRKTGWGRRSPTSDEDDDVDSDNISWVSVEAPWNPLDDDGQELTEEFSDEYDSGLEEEKEEENEDDWL